MLLALTMFREVTERFHAETGAHDLLLILHHVHLVGVPLEMSRIFAIRNFILHKVFYDIAILIVHYFLSSTIIVTRATSISQLRLILGILILLVRVDAADM
jgi:hypothetical protein